MSVDSRCPLRRRTELGLASIQRNQRELSVNRAAPGLRKLFFQIMRESERSNIRTSFSEWLPDFKDPGLQGLHTKL